MTTYRITIAYDGTDFRGYAANPGVRTVQAELEAALATVTGAAVGTTVAGRTDAGVHARANVVSFETDAVIEPGRLQRSITSMLGPEIVAIDACGRPRMISMPASPLAYGATGIGSIPHRCRTLCCGAWRGTSPIRSTGRP